MLVRQLTPVADRQPLLCDIGIWRAPATAIRPWQEYPLSRDHPAPERHAMVAGDFIDPSAAKH
jgi:hypothetical protein